MATHYNFSDVFVSYAHVDRDFVKPITKALAEHGYEIWIDWEDIPQTADWWQEIQAGIDASNTFVFFVSPRSAQSEVCYKEVQYAVDNHKRIVPIMCEAIDDHEVLEKLHPTIRTHNWLIFDDDNPFEEHIKRLIDTLTLELSHLRQHTRYLVRAREWDERKRANSFLLRGTDASEASTWLQISHNKEPKIHPLQIEYIQACSEQLQVDQRLENQQRALLFIERRTFPAFFLGLFIIFYYMWHVFPDASLVGLERLQLSLGLGAAFGVIFAAIALYADELVNIRFPNQFYLRVLASLVFSILFAMIANGIIQASFYDFHLNFVSLAIGWLGFGSSFFLCAAFKLKGWQAFLISLIANFSIILLMSETPDTIWEYPFAPIYYFDTSTQRIVIGFALAFTIAVGGNAWALFQDILRLLPEHLREQPRIKNLID